MSQTVPQPSWSATSTAEVISVPKAVLIPNPWNPNRMTAQAYAKLLESIATYGFIDPLLIREKDSSREYQTYEIVGGAHRFQAGTDLGMTEFPCVNLGVVPDATAKKLTIIDNELHGQADPTRMGDLLAEILQLTSLDDLLVALPYSEDVLAGYLNTDALPDLPGLDSPAPSPGDTSKEAWVERLYRLPKSVAVVLDEAIEKAKDGDDIENWQALERIAADYLGT